MPGLDGSGPSGRGPMTGGGRGYCVMPYTETMPHWGGGGFSRRGGGLGRGRGYGRGRGFGFGWRAGMGVPPVREMTVSEEVSMLREQAEVLKSQLSHIEQHINTIKEQQQEEQ